MVLCVIPPLLEKTQPQILKDKNFALDTFTNSWNTYDSTRKKETFYSTNSLNSSRIMKSMCGVHIANASTLSWSSITICLVGRKRVENMCFLPYVFSREDGKVKAWRVNYYYTHIIFAPFSLLHFPSSLKKLQPNALLVSGLFTSHAPEERWEANAPNSLFTTCAPYNYWLSCFIFSSSSSDSSTGCIRSATLWSRFS